MSSTDIIGKFAIDIPHREPDEHPCELRSCPRPATTVLLLRGAYRVRCDVHAGDLRRQGAEETTLEPGFDQAPVKQTTLTETPMPVFPSCSWPDCDKPNKDKRFCHRCDFRLRTLYGTTSGLTVEQLTAAPALWTKREDERVILSPSQRAAIGTRVDAVSPPIKQPCVKHEVMMDPSGPTGILDVVLRTVMDLPIDAPPTRVIDCARRMVVVIKGVGKLLEGAEAQGEGDILDRLTAHLADLQVKAEKAYSAGWVKASGETDALGRELVEAHRELARTHGEIQNLKDERDAAVRERTCDIDLARTADAAVWAVDAALGLTGALVNTGEGTTRSEGDRLFRIRELQADSEQWTKAADELSDLDDALGLDPEETSSAERTAKIAALTSESEGLRKQVEALSFAAGSWHKAHQAGSVQARPAALAPLFSAATRLASECDDLALVDVLTGIRVLLEVSS